MLRCPSVGSWTQCSPHMLWYDDVLPDCREKAIFGPAKQTSSDEVFAAIKRTFQALDDEIIKEAMSCDIKDCQFGGSTAVIALRIGHVSAAPSYMNACMHCMAVKEMMQEPIGIPWEGFWWCLMGAV